MDTHTGAIAFYLVPLLLSVLCGLASYGLYMHKQFMQRNEHEHEKFFSAQTDHDHRLTRCETKLEHVEKTMEVITLHGKHVQDDERIY